MEIDRNVRPGALTVRGHPDRRLEEGVLLIVELPAIEYRHLSLTIDRHGADGGGKSHFKIGSAAVPAYRYRPENRTVLNAFGNRHLESGCAKAGIPGVLVPAVLVPAVRSVLSSAP